MKLNTLLQKTSPLEIFLHFTPNLEETHIRKSGSPGRNISSPYVEDNNPSFSVYEDRGGKLKFKCHSSGGQGDCFQLVADLNNLDCKTQFNEVLKLINEKMKLGLDNAKKSAYHSEVWKATHYEGFTKKAKEFWLDRNVDVNTLERFGVRQLKLLTFTQANKRVSKFDYQKDGVVAFEFTVNGRKKLYVPSGPNPKLRKKYYCKNQNNSDIFGLRQLPKKKQKYLLICEGEGDVLCASAHGLPAVCFQSANTNITKRQLRELKHKASNLILCYDIDEAGKKAASNLCWKYPSLINLEIPRDNLFVIGKESNPDNEGLVLYWQDLSEQQLELYNVSSEGKEAESYKDLSDWLPNGNIGNFRTMIDRAIKDGRKSQFLHIWEYGNSYMKLNQKTGQQEMVANFLIEADAQILKEADSLRLVRFIARNYKTDTLAVPGSLFNSPDKLSDYLSTLRGNFRFNGSKKDLIAIQQMTFDLSDCLEEVDKMGWNKRHHCFVLSNAVLNGKIDTPNGEGILGDMYIPVANDANSDNSAYATDAKFRFMDDSKIKKPYQFFNILASSYSPQIATMSFAFVFAGLFFDWIARKGMQNQFPMFGLFGQKGCGKGSLVKLLMKLFTSDPEEVSITNTTKTGFVRVMEQANNIPAILDEFRNTVKLEKIEALKNIYDLIGKVIGVKSGDSRTKRSKILRPTFIFGQEAPVNEALFSRLIAINMAIVEKTPAEIKAFSQNMAELDKGIGIVLFKLLGFRDVVIDHFKPTFFDLVEYFGTEVAEKRIKANTRLLNNYACIIAPLIIALENGLKLSRDGTPEKEIRAVKKYALETLMNQASEESELDEVNKFLEVIMICATQSKPLLFPGHDFIVSDDGKELTIKVALATQFNKLYKLVFNHEGPDQSAIKKYIIHKPYFVKKTKARFLITGADNNVKNARSSPLWAYLINTKKLPEELRDYYQSIPNAVNQQYAITAN